MTCPTVGSKALHGLRRGGFIRNGIISDGMHIVDLTASGRKELNLARADRLCSPPLRMVNERRFGSFVKAASNHSNESGQ